MISNSDSNKLEKLIERLKVRLALAKFKCQYGYEKVDLYTLESFDYQSKLNITKDKKKKKSFHFIKEYQRINQKNKYNYFTKKIKTHLKSTHKILPPLSEKRSTSIDESTAKLLLWMYQHEKNINHIK